MQVGDKIRLTEIVKGLPIGTTGIYKEKKENEIIIMDLEKNNVVLEVNEQQIELIKQ